jgi:hypothetical protein
MGSGSNKYIEIYNPDAVSHSLAGWSLRQYNDGNAPGSGYILNLSGTVAPGAVYVVKNSAASGWTGWTEDVGMSTGNIVMTFNGNDAIGLYKGSTLVDIVGQPGNGAMILENVTLVRCPVAAPSPTYDTLDWYRLSSTYTYLGTHNAEWGIDTPEYPRVIYAVRGWEDMEVLLISEYFCGVGNDKYIEIYNCDDNSIDDLAQYSLVKVAIDNASGKINFAESRRLDFSTLPSSQTLWGHHVLVIVNSGYVADRLFTYMDDDDLPVDNGGVYGHSRMYIETSDRKVCDFDGNDPIYLVRSQHHVVDVVGKAQISKWGENVAWIREDEPKASTPAAEWDLDEWMPDDLELDTNGQYKNEAAWWGGWHW